MACGVGQVHGDLPITKFRAILDSIEFSDRRSAQDVASFLADIVAQMGQDVWKLVFDFIVLALLFSLFFLFFLFRVFPYKERHFFLS